MMTDSEANRFYDNMSTLTNSYTEKDFKSPDNIMSIDNSIREMSGTQSKVSMDSFVHTSDFFKKLRYVKGKKVK